MEQLYLHVPGRRGRGRGRYLIPPAADTQRFSSESFEFSRRINILGVWGGHIFLKVDVQGVSCDKLERFNYSLFHLVDVRRGRTVKLSDAVHGLHALKRLSLRGILPVADPTHGIVHFDYHFIEEGDATQGDTFWRAFNTTTYAYRMALTPPVLGRAPGIPRPVVAFMRQLSPGQPGNAITGVHRLERTPEIRDALEKVFEEHRPRPRTVTTTEEVEQ